MEAQRFASGGQAPEFGINAHWQLNTDSTIANKGLKKPLINRGYLQKAATNPNTRFTKYSARITIDPRTKGAGNSYSRGQNYGMIHQNSGDDRQRRFVTITPTFAKIAAQIVSNYIISNGVKLPAKRALPTKQAGSASQIQTRRVAGSKKFKGSVEKKRAEATRMEERARASAAAKTVMRESRQVLGGRSIRSKNYRSEYDRHLSQYAHLSSGKGVRATQNQIVSLRGAMTGRGAVTHDSIMKSRVNAKTLVPGTKVTYEQARGLLKAEKRFQNSLRKGW
jgi:hypothetical protein